MSASIEDAQAILLAFSKKYPFLKTDFFRAGSARLFNRIMNEARAGKVLFDLVAVRGLETHQLVKAGLLQPYVSPESAAYPAGFKDSKGNWVDYFDSYNVIGYNTQRVARDQAPKSWEDLLDPKWKGKIALDEENFSLVWSDDPKMGNGENPTIHAGIGQTGYPASQRQTLIAQLMAAGEFSVAMVLAHRIEKMKEKAHRSHG